MLIPEFKKQVRLANMTRLVLKKPQVCQPDMEERQKGTVKLLSKLNNVNVHHSLQTHFLLEVV